MGEKLFTVTLSESEILEVRYALDRSGAPESLYARLDAATLDAETFGLPTFGSVPLPRPRPANYIEQHREWDGA